MSGFAVTKWISNKCISDKRPMPGAGRLVRNSVAAVARNVASVAVGNPLRVSDDDREFRRFTCATCEHYAAESNRCSHQRCGCYLRFKTWLRAEKCPVGKW